MRVKICGIKKTEDALKAIEQGADAIGLLVGQVHTSNDFISKESAKSIVSGLPPFCSSVLVTHLENNNEIIALAQYIGATTIQLHGDSTPKDAFFIKKELPYIKLIKSLHIINKKSIEDGRKFIDAVDAILLDTVNPNTGQVGGTGKTHDWKISREIVESYNIPIILAGGLNPENIEQAIKEVQPFGVDANSGTKGDDGYKDYRKLKDFIRKAKGTA